MKYFLKINNLYLVPGFKSLNVNILLPSRIIVFSQGTSRKLKSLSSTYIKFPPVIPGNWSWTVVGVICKNWMFGLVPVLPVFSWLPLPVWGRIPERDLSGRILSSDCSDSSAVAHTTRTQHSFLCSGAGLSSHNGSLARNPVKLIKTRAIRINIFKDY